MPLDYKQYQDEVTADIAKVLADASCQPILFVGSGFTKRYANGPSWEELLTALAKACPNIDKEFAYYKQTYNGDLKKIGSVFANQYREWAWGKGKAKFPAEYFSAEAPSDIFIKHTISELLQDLGPVKGSFGSPDLDAEIEALKNISAHAIVTTNYDEVIEPLFTDYKRVIGQRVMREPYLSIGEIFKIHGCRSEPSSIIISEAELRILLPRTAASRLRWGVIRLDQDSHDLVHLRLVEDHAVDARAEVGGRLVLLQDPERRVVNQFHAVLREAIGFSATNCSAEIALSGT